MKAFLSLIINTINTLIYYDIMHKSLKQTRTFGGEKYKKGVGGHTGRRFGKKDIEPLAQTARNAGHKVRVIKISDRRGYAYYYK